MTKIKIIREVNPKEFEKKIKKLFKVGWKIESNFCVDNENYLYVMMIKVEF